MKQYKLVNNVLGWLTFFVAAFVYCSTIEPTASFWDLSLIHISEPTRPY